jgi:hypothetical protein
MKIYSGTLMDMMLEAAAVGVAAKWAHDYNKGNATLVFDGRAQNNHSVRGVHENNDWRYSRRVDVSGIHVLGGVARSYMCSE